MELITVSTQIERRRSNGNQLFKDDESYWLNHGDQ